MLASALSALGPDLELGRCKETGSGTQVRQDGLWLSHDKAGRRVIWGFQYRKHGKLKDAIELVQAPPVGVTIANYRGI